MMEFDSGSSVSVVNTSELESAGIVLNLYPSNKELRVANGQRIKVHGRAIVDVKYNNSLRKQLELFVVQCEFPTLFGRTWIREFCGENWLEKMFADGKSTTDCYRAVSVVDSERPDCYRAVSGDDWERSDCFRAVSDADKDRPGCYRAVSEVGVERPDCRGAIRNKQSCEVDNMEQCEPLSPGDKLVKAATVTVRGCIDPGKDSLKREDCVDPVHSVKQNMLRTIDELKKSPVFNDGLGLVKDYEVQLLLKEGTKPLSVKSRSLPYALKQQVEDELNSMVKDGILKPLKHSPWGTPVVPVVQGEKLRVCGDYKSTLNKVLETKHHPLPTVEECFNEVRGGKKFSKIDIKKAYNNLLIRQEDQELTTLNTHLGQFAWTRLPYGVNSSAAIFQNLMDNVLRGIPMVACRIDDILISGTDDQDHVKNLNEVFKRLEYHGFRCKLQKSLFMQDELTYLGHKVSKKGISPVKSRVSDLMNAPQPENVKELISFLGAIGYYRKYLPHMSTVTAPLDRLRSIRNPYF